MGTSQMLSLHHHSLVNLSLEKGRHPFTFYQYCMSALKAWLNTSTTIVITLTPSLTSQITHPASTSKPKHAELHIWP